MFLRCVLGEIGGHKLEAAAPRFLDIAMLDIVKSRVFNRAVYSTNAQSPLAVVLFVSSSWRSQIHRYLCIKIQGSKFQGNRYS